LCIEKQIADGGAGTGEKPREYSPEEIGKEHENSTRGLNLGGGTPPLDKAFRASRGGNSVGKKIKRKREEERV